MIILNYFFYFFFCLSILSWALSQATSHAPTQGANQSTNQASTQSEKSRYFELVNPVNKTKKVKGEPKVMLNDPTMAQTWGLKKSDTIRAWDISKGSKKIVVAVIDTGIDINHEDFKHVVNNSERNADLVTKTHFPRNVNVSDNFWRNSGETGMDKNGRDKSNNHIDDDENGFVDDVYGWNFVSNNNDLSDNNPQGHGTHIAGIIGAVSGNGKGIAGMAPEVSLMILKYIDPKVPNTKEEVFNNSLSAIRYAIKMKANIINYSGGGIGHIKEEKDLIAEAGKQGILFVAAAGNEKSNSDHFNFFPADYGLSNIISVTAIDPVGEVLPSSN